MALRPASGYHDARPELLSRQHPPVARYDASRLINEDRDSPTPLADRRRNLGNLLRGMRPGVSRIRGELGDRAPLDLICGPIGYFTRRPIHQAERAIVDAVMQLERLKARDLTRLLGSLRRTDRKSAE